MNNLILFCLLFTLLNLLFNNAHGQNSDIDGSTSEASLVNALYPVNLVCKDTGKWYKGNVLLSNDVAFEDDNYNLQVSPDYTQMLTVKRPDASDSGYGIYRSVSICGQNCTSCNFSMFVYDPVNYRGAFSFQNSPVITFDSSSGSVIQSSQDIVIDSFSKTPLTFNYRFEALPLDYLTINGKNVSQVQTACNSSFTRPALNCRETLLSSIQIDECPSSSSVGFTLNYGYAHAENYKNVTQSWQREHTIIYQLKYPPKVENPAIKISVEKNSINTYIPLKCAVKCGNPSAFTFTWRRANGTALQVPTTNSTYYFLIPESIGTTDEVIQLQCLVENSIKTNYTQESTTLFVIELNTADRPGAGLGLREIILISITALLLIIIIVILILICFRKAVLKKKNSDITNIREIIDKGNSTNQRRDISSQLTVNPVYGVDRLENANNTTAPPTVVKVQAPPHLQKQQQQHSRSSATMPPPPPPSSSNSQSQNNIRRV